MGSFRFESGQIYLSEYAIPYFHFHLTTAYCLLRHLGVPVGAMDVFGGCISLRSEGGSARLRDVTRDEDRGCD